MRQQASYPVRPTVPTLQDRALRAIAVFEGLKGLAAIASSIGLLSLLHHDLHHLALELVGHFGLDPAQHYPALLLHYVDALNATPVSTLMLFASVYVSTRLVEAYGLWQGRRWGEWLGALSGALYVPFEVRHLIHQPNFSSLAVLSLNVAMVVFLALQLRQRRAAPGKARRGP
jgi:uncharacterized membrane protein (DUF2068 family)